MRGSFRLIDNGAATGPWVSWLGGKGTFSATATSWNGAKVTLQMKGPDGVTGLSLGEYVELTANGAGGFEAAPCELRAAVSGGTPAGVIADIVGMGR